MSGFQVCRLGWCLRPKPFRFAHQLFSGSQVKNACHHHNGDSLFSSKTGANIVFSKTTARTAPIISDTHQTQWWAHSLLVTAGPKTRAGFIQPAPTCHPAKTPWNQNQFIWPIRSFGPYGHLAHTRVLSRTIYSLPPIRTWQTVMPTINGVRGWLYCWSIRAVTVAKFMINVRITLSDVF